MVVILINQIKGVDLELTSQTHHSYIFRFMDMNIILRLAGGVLLILANAFFVTTEFALTRAPQFDEEDYQDDPALKRAWEMTRELEIYLTGCQLGISSTSILLGIVAEPAVSELLRPVLALLGISGATLSAISVTVSIVLINLIHKIWGEQAPTYLGVERPKQVARYCATPLYWWVKITYPFILLGDGLAKKTLNLFGVEMTRSWKEAELEEGQESDQSRTNLKSQVADLVQGKGLSDERQQEIKNTVEIGKIPITDIMVPRDEIIPLSTEKDFDENLAIIRDTMHNRYPLVRNDIDDYAGILYAAEILGRIEELQNGEIILDDLDHYDMAVPPQLKISELIDRFQSNKQELALVIEDEKVQGLVTLTDAVEVIIGSAEDPIDKEKGQPDNH